MTPSKHYKLNRKKERILWIGLSLILSFSIIALLFAPTVMAQSKATETQELLSLFEQVFYYVQNNYVEEVDPQSLIEGAFNGLFESLDDPFSYYLTDTDIRDLSDTTTGEFGGVGLYIQKQSELETGEGAPSYVLVVSPIEGTPAYRANIHAQDLIVEIEGESTADLSIEEVMDRLRGVPGTEVTITIKRGNIKFPVTLERAKIEIPVVKYEMMNNKIGYLRIIQFTPHTPSRVKEAIEDFKEQDFESLIIDLRGNGGGLLESVVDTVDYFFDEGLIVGTESRIAYKNEKFEASPGKIIDKDIPITVLVNNGSASAAEIMAGALKDRDRAILIGGQTYGKGSVQEIRYISTGGFRLTMSRYYTPDGTIIDKVGIAPDVKITEPELTDAEEDSYMKLLEENRINKFVDDNPDPTEREIKSFIMKLKDEGIELREIFIRRLIQNNINRRMDFPPLYNLELDKVLRKAVEMLEAGEVG